MDRNGDELIIDADLAMSLSARRAWIEIPALQIYWLLALVALRKESVDRNNAARGRLDCCGKSLSARRAWIEMRIAVENPIGYMCRSPQGERG